MKAIKNLNYLNSLTEMESSIADKEDSIIEIASAQLARKRSIWKAKQIQTNLKNEQGMDVSLELV